MGHENHENRCQDMKKLLITGASGFLGWNLCQRAKSDWEVFGAFLSHTLDIPDIKLFRIDLTRYDELKGLFGRIKPHAVIHTAAITDPNFCHKNRSISRKINTEAAINMAGLCSDTGIPYLFTSSDLVFDGLNPPYVEEDEPSPVSYYGEHKALAESGIKDRYPPAVICRMPLMFGDPGPVATSFIQPLIKKMTEENGVNLFVDEFRTPVSGKDAARGIMIALDKLPEIIHLGGPERISRYEFGKLVADTFKIRDAKLNACNQEDIKMAADRPPDVSFDSSKAMDMGFEPGSLVNELKELRDAVKDN
jgi:dTDP-4-dehydrorhamnose reductase